MDKDVKRWDEERGQWVPLDAPHKPPDAEDWRDLPPLADWQHWPLWRKLAYLTACAAVTALWVIYVVPLLYALIQ